MKDFVIRSLTKVLEYLIILSMIGIIIILSLDVFLRYFFSRPFSWGEEVSILLMIWVTFLTASILQKEGGHVSIGYVFGLFPTKLKMIVTGFGNLCICLVLVIHLISSINLVKLQSGTFSPALRFPMNLFSISVLIGIASMLIFTVDSVIKQFKNNNSGKISE